MRIRHVTDETVVDVGPENIGKTVASGDGLVWVDFDHTDESGMAMLPDLFDVHPADVADCQSARRCRRRIATPTITTPRSTAWPEAPTTGCTSCP